MSRPEQTIAFRAYFQGTDLLGVATIEMPQVQFLTETISGSGVAGEYESPALGMTQSMSAKLSWVSQTKEFYKLLDATLPPLLELRASVQREDEATGIRKAVPLLVTLLAVKGIVGEDRVPQALGALAFCAAFAGGLPAGKGRLGPGGSLLNAGAFALLLLLLCFGGWGEGIAVRGLIRLALILLGGLLAALLCGKVGKRPNKRLVKSHKKLRSV